MIIRGKSKQTRNYLQVSFVKIGRFSLSLWNGQMDSLLSVYFYLNLSTLKMCEIQQITSAGAKIGISSEKYPFPSAATFGFKSLVL
jgi:hypothetical protein